MSPSRYPVAYLTAVAAGLAAAITALGDLSPGWLTVTYTVIMAVTAVLETALVTPVAHPNLDQDHG